MKRTGFRALLGAASLFLLSVAAAAQMPRPDVLIASSTPRPAAASHLGRLRGYGAPCHSPVARHWVPGAYRTISKRVWIPAFDERVWVDPVTSYRRDPCGRLVPFLESAGHWVTVEHPGRHEWVSERVWVPGHWSYG